MLGDVSLGAVRVWVCDRLSVSLVWCSRSVWCFVCRRLFPVQMSVGMLCPLVFLLVLWVLLWTLLLLSSGTWVVRRVLCGGADLA